MGTEKRERQKANRQQRLIEEARVERSGKIKRNIVRWTLAAIAAVAAVVVIAWVGGAFDSDDEATETTPPPVDPAPTETTPPGGTTAADPETGKPSVQLPEEIPTELVVTDIEVGEGDPAENGDTLAVHYVGVRSVNGEEFDSNFGGTPFELTLGAGGVIDGWDQGLVGVREGGVRQLDIPADLAYGDQARGTIQPGDALSFVVEVVAITPGGSE